LICELAAKAENLIGTQAGTQLLNDLLAAIKAVERRVPDRH
jgi:hypothetical protein